MITAFLASQILVGIAILTDFTSFQFKDRKKIILFLCISSALISSHYFLLGKNTAGVLVSISILRFIISYFSTRKIFMFAMIGLSILAFIFTYSSAFSFIILTALILTTIGSFQEEDKHLRIFLMIGAILIMIYDILIFSPMAILLESSYLIGNLIGYYRFYMKKVPVIEDK